MGVPDVPLRKVVVRREARRGAVALRRREVLRRLLPPCRCDACGDSRGQNACTKVEALQWVAPHILR